ncbi:MAG: GGDEF domain-containing protein, partial [Candidatus Diapherotrites archaeon]|nr:GGDEF domain-containing protein [Candidatus Diapherotrites archaeon]
MAKVILPRPFVLGRRKKLPSIRNPTILAKGYANLTSAAGRMRARELRKLSRMVKTGAGKKMVQAQIARIRSLNRKASGLIEPRLRNVEWVMRRDPEFHSLLDRSFFFENLNQALKRKGPHSLVYIDMDHLKKINNRFGRKEGGFAVLSAHANALSQAVAKFGFAGHIGGDEFLLYLRMSPNVAQAFLSEGFEQLRMQELKKWPLYNKAVAAKLPLTYSAGIIGLKPGANVETAEEAADKLCSKAKRL